MLLIVVTHFLIWGTTHCAVGPIEVSFTNGWALNPYLFPFVSSLSSVGVIIFVLISSFFLCQKTELGVSRIFKVWSVAAFYSVLFAVMAFVNHSCGIKDLVLSIFPVGTDRYWFVTKYIALMCLAPIYAIVVDGTDKRGHQLILAILALLVVNITHGVPYGNTFFSDSPNSVAAFSLIFFIAAYIRKYGEGEFLAKYSGLIFLGFIVLQGVGGLVINYTRLDSPAIFAGFSGGNNGLSLVPATALFIWFKNHSSGEGMLVKALTKLAPYSFAVYLVHDNGYFRGVLWNDIIDPAKYRQSPMWLLLLIVVPVCIYLACACLDAVRSFIFKLARIDKLADWIKKYNLTIK